MNAASGPIPVSVRTRRETFSLSAFDKQLAPMVAGWAETRHELLWLAPKTFPPLTAAKVLAWLLPGGSPLLLYREGASEPQGYLELNPMPGERDHLWLGHCVVRPELRGRGLGKVMVRLMLDEAFAHRRAERVSLVVFPDNLGAIRCYAACGFIQAGKQTKFFATTGREHVMLQMSIERERYALLRPGADKR